MLDTLLVSTYLFFSKSTSSSILLQPLCVKRQNLLTPIFCQAFLVIICPTKGRTTSPYLSSVLLDDSMS
jgi:hypothetical protein